MSTNPNPGKTDAKPSEAERGNKPQQPHVTNGAEASNLPPDADLPDLTDHQPSEVIKRAKQDLDEGQVDTDLRAKPGLDADTRKKLLNNKSG